MRPSFPPAIENLLQSLRRLPGVGQKTALRYAFALLRAPAVDRAAFAQALTDLNRGRLVCSTCFHVAGNDPCMYCADPERSNRTICVVAEPQDLLAIEATGAYKGRYHVLGGVIRPLDGLRPEDLTVTQLEERIKKGKPEEVILALDPDMDGETTLLYLRKRLAALPVRLTRLARGLPVGGDLEYADETTLSDALTGRREA
ncbi:recombination protein RecR [Patescibacteria group bacterium]|nr:MAG: recombination protein RecR [Patescibacteria group bacterium]